MLRVTSTKNLMGIVIHGDYDDLNCLYDSLYECLDFYYDNLSGFCIDVYGDEQKQKKLEQLEQERDYFLALNYDIRHAYMGNRNYELRDNNASILDDYQTYFPQGSKQYKNYKKLYKMTQSGNLQFSAEILFPLAVSYIYMIHDFLEMFLSEEDMSSYQHNFTNYKKPMYNLYQSVGILMHFEGLLMDALSEILGKQKTNHLFNYLNENVHFTTSTLYPEALCSWYCSQANHKPSKIKEAMILVMAYELYDSAEQINIKQFKQSQKDYLAALSKINDAAEIPFPTYNDFITRLNNFVDSLDHDFYRDDFDQFLINEYNDIDDGYEVFETNPWPEGF